MKVFRNNPTPMFQPNAKYKRPWICEDNKNGEDVDGPYPAQSHDCMPHETEFANCFEDAQIDVERREKNANKRRTMSMWRNTIHHT